MLQIDDTIISFDVLEEQFVCDLHTCKGICCVEGDDGAPLEEHEVKIIEDLLPLIWDDLSEKSREVISKQGVSYIDDDGEPVTSIVNGAECVFTYFDEKEPASVLLRKLIAKVKPVFINQYPAICIRFGFRNSMNLQRSTIIVGAYVVVPVRWVISFPCLFIVF